MTPAISQKPASLPAETDPAAYDRSGEELEFWMGCVGAPLVLVEKATLAVRRINPSARAFFGLGNEPEQGLPIEALVGPEAAAMLSQVWYNAPVGQPGEHFIIRAVVQEQERSLVVQVTKLAIDGELLRLFTFTDAPPEGTMTLAGWQEDVVSMLNWLPFGFEIADSGDQMLFVNSTFKELFGYTQDEIATLEDWWRIVYPDPDYREYARSTWNRAVAEARSEKREMTPFDLTVVTASGEKRRVQFRHRAIGKFHVNMYIDVTRERAYADELERLANTDSLTGLLNRRSFFDRAEQVHARIGQTPGATMALLMLDIDHFKSVNDHFGHSAGDHVLAEFARRCGALLESGNCLARLGGEEFALIVEGADLPAAHALGERIRLSISADTFRFDEAGIGVTASIGVALSSGDGESFGSLVSRADKALYQAKREGRNRVILSAH